MDDGDNSDIGRNPNDPAFLRSQFPNIAEALIWPELVETFDRHENAAKLLKTSSRRSSIAAIAAMVTSLLLTLVATSDLIEGVVSAYQGLSRILAVLSLFLLVAAVFLGKGIMLGRRRDEWLRHRIIAERIRQFFFQFLLANRYSICGEGFLSTTELRKTRALALEAVKHTIEGAAYIQIVRDDATLEEARMIETGEDRDVVMDVGKLEEFERYWRRFRFQWQAEYATKQVMRRASPFPMAGSLADQNHTIGTLEFIATVAIVVLQIVAVFSQLFAPPENSLVSVSVLLASVCAIIVVGLLAFKDGMGLTEDLSRNRVYASYVAKLLRDFEVARETDGMAAQFRVMQEMEDLAYFEAREFLHTHSTARFSL